MNVILKTLGGVALALTFGAAFAVAADGAEKPDIPALYADYPEEIAEIFGAPVLKRDFLEHCRAHADEFPELLPEPYRHNQLANVAYNYVRHREIEVGAKNSGYLPTPERAAAAIARRIAEMSEAERAKLDSALAAMHTTLEEYAAGLAADPAFQKSAAEREFMEMLADKHKVTEADVEAYFEERKAAFAHDPDTYVNFIMRGLGDRNDGKEQLHERAMVDYKLLNRLDALADGETGAPFEYKDKVVTVTRLPLPEPVLSGGIRNRLREELQSSRRGTADSSLHEMSGVKYNFKLPETDGNF